MMDDKDRTRLRKAINRAADHARPVRGKDEVALRTSDWHAILKFVEVGQPLGFVLAQAGHSEEPTP
jgi:hypothetical protein